MSREPAPRPRPQGTRPRFDHGAAKAYFVALPPGERRYAAVARKFGVSDVTIRKWARRDEWEAAAALADRKAAAAVLAQAERTREQRAVQTARLRDLAADQIEGRLASGKLDDERAVHVWKEADRQWRLDIGELTDKIGIDVPQVRELVEAFVDGVDELLVAVSEETLANGKRSVLLRAFRSGLPAVLERAAGGIALEAGDGE